MTRKPALLSVTAPALLLTFSGLARSQAPPYPTMGAIVRLNSGIDRLIPRDAKIEVLASGMKFAEGPIWVREGGYLLFSDIPRNSVMKWKEAEGLSLFMKPSGYTGVGEYSAEPGSNGLMMDSEGRVVFCEHGDRRISRLEKGGGKKTVADSYMGKRLNSPNDGVFKSNGDLYFTDPPYGLPEGGKDWRRELDFSGVFRVSRVGEITLLSRDMTFPNGIAFSPDEKTLYVSQSDPQRAVWMAFPVKADGTLGIGRVFYDVTSAVNHMPGLPDGMKVDREGNLFASGPGGIYVLTPGGACLGRIDTGGVAANCAWGGDGSVLYIAADSYLCRIHTSTKGPGW